MPLGNFNANKFPGKCFYKLMLTVLVRVLFSKTLFPIENYIYGTIIVIIILPEVLCLFLSTL